MLNKFWFKGHKLKLKTFIVYFATLDYVSAVHAYFFLYILKGSLSLIPFLQGKKLFVLKLFILTAFELF